ncbi:MAG: exodeoxyribonuclease III [Bacteroidota bacterium]
MHSIISYNVNGIRAAEKKGFYTWLQEENPNVICLQETKAQPEQLTEAQLNPAGYHAYWHSAVKKGYSGVAIFSREEPKHVEYGIGVDKFDNEGRVLRADFEDYSLIGLYLPSGSSGDHRQAMKDEFIIVFKDYIKELKQEFPKLVISGDYNIVHKPIDIHDPVKNKNSSGFLPHEREWLTEFMDLGFEDSFRKFHSEGDNYTWWSYRTRARDKNKGWRIDYQMISSELASHCTGASILSDIVHSDHCPIKIELDLG